MFSGDLASNVHKDPGRRLHHTTVFDPGLRPFCQKRAENQGLTGETGLTSLMGNAEYSTGTGTECRRRNRRDRGRFLSSVNQISTITPRSATAVGFF